jgi:hypothetical protein
VTLDAWREALFALAWRQHGGSGMAASLGDVLDLPLADRDWLLERIGEQRTREARELERSSRRR